MARLDSITDLKKPGAKNDAGKLRFDLIDDIAEEALVAVLTLGAAKYTPGGWREVEDPYARYWSALRRHAKDLRKYLRTRNAEDRIDYETGLPTSAQLLCNAMFLCALDIAEHEGEGFDGAEAAKQAIAKGRATLGPGVKGTAPKHGTSHGMLTGKQKSGHYGGRASARSSREEKSLKKVLRTDGPRATT